MGNLITETTKRGGKPSFRVTSGAQGIGTVFQNWQGWCWARWNDEPMTGSRAVGVRASYEEALAALEAA